MTIDSRQASRATLMAALPALLAGFLLAGHEEARVGVHPAAFERLKSLAGDWEGMTSEGSPVSVTYRLTAGGSALIADISFPENPDHDMATVFHPDGGRVMLTHYCSDRNQPRMTARAWSPGDATIVFDFKDVTGLVRPDAGHMHRLVLEFRDANHYTETWTYRKTGADDTQTVFDLRRRN